MYGYELQYIASYSPYCKLPSSYYKLSTSILCKVGCVQYLWTFSMAATSASAAKLKKAGSSCGTVLLSASSALGLL